MATGPNVCNICLETFRAPEFAERCQAQGRPPLVYHVGDILLKEGKPPHLLVITNSKVHHGTGKCPVDGPCEHVVFYSGYLIYPGQDGSGRVWSGGGHVRDECNLRRGYDCIATLNFPGGLPWGVIFENGSPEAYLVGPRPEDGWRRLWEMWDAMAPKKRGRPRKDRQLPLLKKEE